MIPLRPEAKPAFGFRNHLRSLRPGPTISSLLLPTRLGGVRVPPVLDAIHARGRSTGIDNFSVTSSSLVQAGWPVQLALRWIKVMTLLIMLSF
jgi:hypothetical protein